MTTYPGAKFRPLAAEQGQPRMARHDIVCLHTMVGNLSSTDRMFRANGWGGTESHFGVGGKWGDGLDGVVYQWQDTEFQADANLEGNRRIISIETGDNAPQRPSDIEPWTAKQQDAIVAITAWACKKYDIPAVLIPDSKPGRRGIGYHRLGCQHSGGTHPAGFLQVGGEEWSSSVGKECPTPARIAQIPGIVARVKAVLAGKTQEADVALSEPDLAKIANEVWTAKPALAGQQVDGLLHELDLRSASTEKRLGALEAELGEVKAQAASNGGQLSNLTAKVDQILAALAAAPPLAP